MLQHPTLSAERCHRVITVSSSYVFPGADAGHTLPLNAFAPARTGHSLITVQAKPHRVQKALRARGEQLTKRKAVRLTVRLILL